MKIKNYKKMLPLLCSAVLISWPASAQQLTQQPVTVDAFTQSIDDIQSQWDAIKYTMTNKDAQIKALATLESKSESVVTNYPDRAEPKIWEGIVYSTDAGIGGGLSALSKVKKAKALFEEALKIDEGAMNAGAHTSLGSLYYQVPGWPVAFGDNDEAEKHLKAALAISPDDIDANYFYADYLIYRKKYGDAAPILEKAAQAPMRSGREIADAGRRREIQADMLKAQEGMKR